MKPIQPIVKEENKQGNFEAEISDLDLEEEKVSHEDEILAVNP